MQKSASRIVLSHLAGFLLFIVLLSIANLLNITNPLIKDIITFLNGNILLLMAMMVFGILNDILWSHRFPWNVLAPFSAAVLGVLIVTFICRIFGMLNEFLHFGDLPCAWIATVVFFIVLIGAYATLLVRGGRPREEWHEDRKKRVHHEWPEWKDVEKEFRMAMYNLGKSLEKAFGPKK
jgi:hypothetical protein